MDIVAFLTARLDEDEAVARLAPQGHWILKTDGTDSIVREELHHPADLSGDFVCYVGRFDESAAHIARHDPARVLADVAAKRRILAEYKARDGDADLMLGPNILRQREWSGLRLAVHLLALPFAEHPDYNESWRP